ncbi:extracellular solute-binding protein [Cryobacterium sp.]|uniref:ABC transporter substrate-binding protein n=1 Tax=Cryobacterium sp. TaxID=1926290 RepID=UPI0026083FEB|nr:extracellular solute-binding protein [Cryobacterium sp.]MCU1447451.1 transporter substrate-binding protein [Cryobacterium sp.]
MAKNPVRWSALGIVAVLTLASCATGSSTTTDDNVSYDPDASLSGDLSIMGFGAGDEVATARLDRTKEILGADVKVSLIEGDLDIQQFLSAVAAGDPPELVYADRAQIGSFAARGAIISLDKCISGEKIDTEQYRVPAIDQVTFNDSIYGIPEFNQIQVTMANTSLLDAAGLTIDDVNGSDWSAMGVANQKLAVNSGGVAVIGVDPKLPEFLPLWAAGNGGALLSSDGKTAQLADPEVVKALEFGVGLYEAQGGFAAVKAFRDSADFFGAGNQFATNTLGAMPMEQWYINVLNDVSPDATISFDTVRDTQGKPMAFAGGSAWAIPAGSDNPAAACRFAATMTEVDAWLAAAEARIAIRAEEGKPFTGILTGNEVADDKVRSLVESTGSAQWDSAIEAMYEANDNTFSLPPNPADAEFTTIWQDAVNRVLNGQDTAQSALEDANVKAQEALDKAWADIEGKG